MAKNVEHGDEIFYATPKMSELLDILQIVNSLFNAIDNDTLLEEDKQFYNFLLSSQYNSKINPSITAIINKYNHDKRPCSTCGKIHKGIPAQIFNLKEEITNKINIFSSPCKSRSCPKILKHPLFKD